jgi:pyruvate formate-lyase activating enzyme-like uncharacterized protein
MIAIVESKLPGEVSDYGIAYLPGITVKELSQGCQSCKKGSWLCLRPGLKCNLSCSYCLSTEAERLEEGSSDFYIGREKIISETMLKEVLSASHGIDGISYSGGEPFLYIEKIVHMANFITKNLPSVYQWVYTNGVLATYESMKKLNDSGIQEIRFHIGASHFSAAVMRNLKTAVGIFETVTVETPSTPELYDYLIVDRRVHFLEDSGVKQLNLPEVSSFRGKINYEHIPADHYVFSGSAVRLVSPSNSHAITRTIMSYCSEHRIDLVVNDCSNEAKDLQVRQRFFAGRIPNEFFDFKRLHIN